MVGYRPPDVRSPMLKICSTIESMLKFTGERMIPKLNHSAGFYFEHIARYLYASTYCKGKRVLDVGSGAGYGSFILAQHGKAKSVHGIDIDPETVTYAQKIYGTNSNKVSYAVDSAETLSTIKDSSYDIVVCFELIEHITKQSSCISHIKRILKPDGILIISTPNKFTYPDGNEFHLKELYPKQFEKLIRTHFKQVTMTYQSLHLAQVIQAIEKPIKILDDKLVQSTAQSFHQPVNQKNEEYIICIASNKKTTLQPNHISTTKQIDFIDLHRGLIEFEKKYYEAAGSLQYEEELAFLRTSYASITSSKFYKLWQAYCHLREKLLKRS